MESLLTSVDIYCERLGPGLWAEPLNAMSNLLFFMAALALYQLARTSLPPIRPRLMALSTLIALIGAGSLLFHTFANRLTGLLDIGFIAIFIVYYVWMFIREHYEASRMAALGCLGLFFFATYLFSVLAALVGWQTLAVYISSLTLLWIFSADLWRRSHSAAKPMVIAAILFTLSLTSRTLDMPYCHENPYGTHYIWHSLNALVLYYLGVAMLQVLQQKDTSEIESSPLN